MCSMAINGQLFMVSVGFNAAARSVIISTTFFFFFNLIIIVNITKLINYSTFSYDVSIVQHC
jgi:hypothetical protein